MPDSIGSATGRGVKIAIIDDGICSNPSAVYRLAGGARIVNDADNGLIVDDNYVAEGFWSHGTMCATVISHRVPEVEIYSLKVLDGQGKGHPLTLGGALSWAIDHQIDIANISLGMTGELHLSELREQCAAAAKAGIILVAATHIRGLTSYPSAFPEMIAVGKDDRYKDYEYGFYPGRLAEFLASGQGNVTLEKLNPAAGHRNFVSTFGGTSVAAARMTANVAALLQIVPALDLAQLKDELAAREMKLPARSARIWPVTTSLGEESAPSPANTRTDQLKRVAIYPFDNTTETIIANRDQFDFQIDCVIDPVHPSIVGKDAGLLYGNSEVGIPAFANLDGIKLHTETVIIGDLEELRRAERKDYLREALEWAVRNNKHVFSLGPVEPQIYRKICLEAEQKRIHLASAHAFSQEIASSDISDLKFDVDVPVIGVFGTSFNQGKFATQLGLRRWLGREGYETALVGTNPICALLKRGVYMTQDLRCAYTLPVRTRTAYWETAVARAFSAWRPHAIIVGSQGGIVPPKLYSVISENKLSQGYINLPSDYSLPTLALLMATKPDAVVLVVNSIDREELIRKSISTIENLSQARVIALVFADKLVIEDAYRFSQQWGRTLVADEMARLQSLYLEKFGLPAFCPFIPEQQRELAQLVIKSFEVP